LFAFRAVNCCRIPNPTLTTHDGRAVRFYDDLVRGKVVVLAFAYTRCEGSCPITTAKLAGVQRRLGERVGDDVSLVTITLDPDHDTQERLAEYASTHGAGPGWTFLTGSRPDLDAIRRHLGFWDPDPAVDADRTQHAAKVLIGDDRTGRWVSVPGYSRVEELLEAVRRLAGDGRGGAHVKPIAEAAVAERIPDHPGLDSRGPPLARDQAPPEVLDPARSHAGVLPAFPE